MLRGDNRGLSEVVTTLILVLLVLVAIGIVWVVVNGILKQGTGQIDSSQFTTNLEISNVEKSLNQLEVSVERKPGRGDVSGVKFVFDKGDGSSVSVDKFGVLNELDSENYVFTSSDISDLILVEKVSIYPIYSDGKTGSLSDTEIFSVSLENLPDNNGQGEVLYSGNIYSWGIGTSAIVIEENLGSSGTISLGKDDYKLVILGGNNHGIILGVENLQLSDTNRDFFVVHGSCNNPPFTLQGNYCEDSNSNAPYKIYKINN